jgi:hypothetical protein
MQCRIFLSYGHDEHRDLALRLKVDLEARGHEVWFDEERLRPGADWEAGIEAGLEWACAEPDRGRLLLMMTPHAVRRPDGYCLNELSRALRRGLSIVPVMVAWCEPPLSIDRIQWLDLRDCVPIAQQPASYQGKLERLATAMETNRLDLNGLQARLGRALDPLSFDTDIHEHLGRFTGRQWVFEELDTWFADPGPERIFWILGPPGIGKTALAANLIWRRPDIVAAHFCRAGDSQKSDARRCVTSIAYHLCTQLPDLEARLASLPLEDLTADASAATLFDRLVVQPLAGSFPKPDRPLAILIDALDEASHNGGNELAEFLADQFSRTPPWLRLIITSRPDPEVMHPLQGIAARRLEAQSEPNRTDIKAYLQSQVPQLAGAEEAAIDEIVARSAGSFLYADFVRRELQSGRLAAREASAFPHGLGAVYAHFARRQWPSIERFKTDVAPGLDVLLAAEAPVSLPQLRRMFGWTERRAQEFRQSLGSLFAPRAGGIFSFHKSLGDWLTNAETAGPYFVDVEAGGERLSCFALDEIAREGAEPMAAVELAFGNLRLLTATQDRALALAQRLADPQRLHDLLLVETTAGEDERRIRRNWLRGGVARIAAVWPPGFDDEPVWRIIEAIAALAWRFADTDWDYKAIRVWDDYGRPEEQPLALLAQVRRYREWIEAILLLTTLTALAGEVVDARPGLAPRLPQLIDARLRKFIETDSDPLVTELLTGAREYLPERNVSFLTGAVGTLVKQFRDDPRLTDWAKLWKGFGYGG